MNPRYTDGPDDYPEEFECFDSGGPEDEGLDSALYYDEEPELDFAEPGGNSALRAATHGNPRNQPCSACGRANRLTPKDVALGYQCDSCADGDERGGP